ncbi:MAG: hypothetical protein GSR73_05575 [Desulfurococcales archaeon]|nr:hypothetical protein [Desulfurococcales archaeon]
MEYNAVLIGFGNVGRELAQRLIDPGTGLPVKVTGVASSRGAVIVGGPGDLAKLAKLARSGEKLDRHHNFREGLDPVEAAILANADVALITIPPSYQTGEPNKTIYHGLVEKGVSIITADKTVLALEGKRLVEEVRRRCLFLGYRATVAAGTPAIDSALGLRLRGVESVRAVLNASTNYILGFVEKGYSYREALEKAIEAKLAEPDPTVDTHGWDPAAKLVILSNTLGYDVRLEDVKRVPLESVGEELVAGSLREGKRVKYVAYADFESGRLGVEPMVLEGSDPLALAEGEENVIVFGLEGTGIVLRGPAGPAWRTAKVMITDILDFVQWREDTEDCPPG